MMPLLTARLYSPQRRGGRRGIQFKIDSSLGPPRLCGESSLGSDEPARLVVDRDLVLEDFLDDDLEVGHVAGALDERAGAVHQLEHALLDQRRQLEPPANLVHDFVALQCFDHWVSGVASCQWLVASRLKCHCLYWQLATNNSQLSLKFRPLVCA